LGEVASASSLRTRASEAGGEGMVEAERRTRACGSHPRQSGEVRLSVSRTHDWLLVV
jgi:hypothetical protein